jgi:glycosyltransferase involved in cell wall biosynthesis
MILERAAEYTTDESRASHHDGAALVLPPLTTFAVAKTKAVTAATLAANFLRETRSRTFGSSGKATHDALKDENIDSPARRSSGITLHQAVPTIGRFDAVSNDALAIQELLQKNGIDSELFAEHIDPSLRSDVWTLDRLRSSSHSDEPVLYHVSTQAPRVVDALFGRTGDLFLRHHNVTPAAWFSGVSAGHESACLGAMEELAALSRRARAGVADSGFNASGLIELGMKDVLVVPILLAPASNPPVWTGGGGYAISIGRIAPNKRIDFVLRTIAAYQHQHDPDFGLVLVGSDRGLERYSAACRELERELGVRNVRWVGSIEEAEKLQLMAKADAYVCASDHEGFCVPIVESFRLGLPVVARATSAVTDTCGNALAVETADPVFLANVLRVVVEDAGLRMRLIATQYEEAKRFDPAVVGQQFLAWVDAQTAR